MKPVIGINCDIEIQAGNPAPFLKPEYSEAVKIAGGMPSVLDPREVEKIRGLLEQLDGLVLSGGADIWPNHYGQEKHAKTNLVSKERDTFDFKLLDQALDMDMPVLGICLGMQLINVGLGGTLIQDIASQRPSEVPHNAKNAKEVHKVKVVKGTRLHKLLDEEVIMVNSSHHQAVDRLAGGLKVSAWAEDGIIEAIESTRHSLVLGVQWHPERMLENPTQRGLFTAFLEEIKVHASKRL